MTYSRILKSSEAKDPSIVLWNPKYPHNVGAALRAASCYGFEQVYFTGDRILSELERRGRLPREERMKGYASVDLINTDRPFDLFPSSVVPIAVEVSDKAETLIDFVHPERAIYVFGPEDGSLPAVALRHCHRHVIIPTAHCLNLATAVATVLYDRRAKRVLEGLEPRLPAGQVVQEQRGFICDLESEDDG